MALLSSPASAQWKWRDKSGQLHLSDVPPPSDVADKDILQRPPAPARSNLPPPEPAPSAVADPNAAAASTPRGDPELEARRAKAEQDEKARRKAVEDANNATHADNCARAKREITTLESGQRIARTNEKGEREILGDEGRAEELQRARNIIASDCK